MDQRISEWLPQRPDAQGLNVQVVRYEDRPDVASIPVGSDGLIYRIKDAFTTWHGTWDVRPGKWGIPQWARDAYLKPMNDPHYCDPGGGDHHIIVALNDVNGDFLSSPPSDIEALVWSTDNLAMPPAGDADHLAHVQPVKKGWGDVPMAGHGAANYRPAEGQHGPYKIAARGASDVLAGMGMPLNEHLSFIVIFQAEPAVQNRLRPHEPLVTTATAALDLTLEPPLPAGIGLVSRGFGDASGICGPAGPAGHEGLDYAAPAGTPVLAAHAGVASVKRDEHYGAYVVLFNADNGVTTLYAHLAATQVSDGQAVTPGQPIGAVGHSGNANTDGLHFGFQVRNVANPAYAGWLDPTIGRLLCG